MAKQNLIALDLAKDVIHVVMERGEKIVVNKLMTVNQLKKFLAKQPHSRVAMEACGTAHYWCWLAEEYGHDVEMLPPLHVKPHRQGNKTDETDALAVLALAKRPDRKQAVKKTPEQLELQMVLDGRQFYVDEKRRLSNIIRSQLLEFGVRIPKGYSKLERRLYEILEDAENGVPFRLRALIEQHYQTYKHADEQLKQLDHQLKQIVKEVDPCRRLTALEGVGPVVAILLYTFIGDGSAFKNGREASACFGATPQQHSTGGKSRIGHIRQKNVDKQRRVTVLQGARSVVSSLKSPKTDKMRWLSELKDRRGDNVAVVALTNKTVRTAWAMLNTGEEYVAG